MAAKELVQKVVDDTVAAVKGLDKELKLEPGRLAEHCEREVNVRFVVHEVRAAILADVADALAPKKKA